MPQGAVLFHPDRPRIGTFEDADGTVLRRGWFDIVRTDADGEVVATYGPPAWTRPLTWSWMMACIPLLWLAVWAHRRSRPASRATAN